MKILFALILFTFKDAIGQSVIVVSKFRAAFELTLKDYEIETTKALRQLGIPKITSKFKNFAVLESLKVWPILEDTKEYVNKNYPDGINAMNQSIEAFSNLILRSVKAIDVITTLHHNNFIPDFHPDQQLKDIKAIISKPIASVLDNSTTQYDSNRNNIKKIVFSAIEFLYNAKECVSDAKSKFSLVPKKIRQIKVIVEYVSREMMYVFDVCGKQGNIQCFNDLKEDFQKKEDKIDQIAHDFKNEKNKNIVNAIKDYKTCTQNVISKFYAFVEENFKN